MGIKIPTNKLFEKSGEGNKRNPKTQFFVLGSPDPHSPDSINYEWLQELNKQKHILEGM